MILKTITIGRDMGSTVEIASGLAPEDRVIESAPDGIGDGDKVNVKEKPNPATAPSTSNGPTPPNKAEGEHERCAMRFTRVEQRKDTLPMRTRLLSPPL